MSTDSGKNSDAATRWRKCAHPKVRATIAKGWGVLGGAPQRMVFWTLLVVIFGVPAHAL
jgi:hypothetical protein